MTRMPASKARDTFSETLNQVANKGTRIMLQRRGKPIAAMVSVEDLKLLEDLEDRLDLEAARKALKEPDAVSWEKVKKVLGLT